MTNRWLTLLSFLLYQLTAPATAANDNTAFLDVSCPDHIPFVDASTGLTTAAVNVSISSYRVDLVGSKTSSKDEENLYKIQLLCVGLLVHGEEEEEEEPCANIKEQHVMAHFTSHLSLHGLEHLKSVTFQRGTDSPGCFRSLLSEKDLMESRVWTDDSQSSSSSVVGNSGGSVTVGSGNGGANVVGSGLCSGTTALTRCPEMRRLTLMLDTSSRTYGEETEEEVVKEDCDEEEEGGGCSHGDIFGSFCGGVSLTVLLLLVAMGFNRYMAGKAGVALKLQMGDKKLKVRGTPAS